MKHKVPPTVASPADDIALSSAIIGIDHSTGEVAVMAAPDETRQRDRFPHVFGACDPYWSDHGEDALRGELLVQIWHAVTLLGVLPSAIHEALLVLPEYRDLMPIEALPKPYRK